MDSIHIVGGKRLEGRIPISGAKNSALTLLPCALLTADKLTLGNLPRLADVDSFGICSTGSASRPRSPASRRANSGAR
jgi:UDP-N-acetylglucosamine 1-carboxyvinyltransferase